MRTYKGRSEQEQKEFNKQRKEAYQRRKDHPVSIPLVRNEDDPDIDINVETEQVEIPDTSWKDKLLARFQSAENEPVSKERVKKTENLLSHVLPMAVSGLLAMYSKNLFSENYKRCAPSKEEVSTILLPIFSVIQRHVAIEGKASQDAIDITTSLLAAITVGMRMQMTRLEISYAISQQETAQPENVSPIRATGRDERRDSSGASASTIRANTGSNGTIEYGRLSGNGHDGNGHDPNGSYDNGAWEAQAVRDLLRKDTQGRRAMGLAPRQLRNDDESIDNPPA